MLTWRPTKPGGEQAAREILSVAMHLHATYKEVWLWRGQTDTAWGLTPGIHSRVLESSESHTEATASKATVHLLKTARAIGVDEYNGARLPDLALLAHLQHYGAATPLLDVSTDPLIALWMAAFKSPERPEDGDGVSGSLFGVLKPPSDRWISPLDAREWSDSTKSVSNSLDDKVWWYQAPDVTERLRIQRGSFLVGPLQEEYSDGTSLPLDTAAQGEKSWIAERIANRGKPGAPARRTTDVFKLEIPAASKAPLRQILMERSGLTVAAVYPIPWHRPYIEEFSRSYGRKRNLSLDI